MTLSEQLLLAVREVLDDAVSGWAGEFCADPVGSEGEKWREVKAAIDRVLAEQARATY